jgi:ankyrin repeat protein
LGGFNELTKLLISLKVDVEAPSYFGSTALNIAANRGFQDVVKTLVYEGKAKLEPATGETALVGAINIGDLGMMELLLDMGADVNACGNDGLTALHHSMLTERDVVDVLLRAGADVHATTIDNRTPLHAAAEVMSMEFIQLLVECGAEVKARDKRGCDALHCMFDPLRDYVIDLPGELVIIEIMDKLIWYGADVGAKDNKGLTILDKAEAKGWKLVAASLKKNYPQIFSGMKQ